MGMRDNIIRGAARLLRADLQKAAFGAQPTNYIAPAQAQGVAASGANPMAPGGGPLGANMLANLPKEWVQALYGPGYPISPMPHPEEAGIPREIDYPIAANISIQPRTTYGLMPFEVLKTAFESVGELQLDVHLITRELNSFQPRLVDRAGNDIGEDHPYSWIIDSPDGYNPFNVWLTRLLQCSLVFDAGCIFNETDSTGSKLKALRYLDGETLYLLVNEHGETPTPKNDRKDPGELSKALEWAPGDVRDMQASFYEAQKKLSKEGKGMPAVDVPAYVQIIKGTPFAWYDASQIWYQPRWKRYNAPYGRAPSEMSWSWVLICANITSFNLAFYREGNQPEGLLIGPQNWSLNQLNAYEQAINARMSSGPAERNRMRVVPFGFAYQATKPPEFPQKLYEQARDNIDQSFGIPPSERGKMAGGGLGGKGFSEMMQMSLYRMALGPTKAWVEQGINNILQKRFGVQDAMLELSVPDETIDPEKQKQSAINLFKAGIITLNDALGMIGYDPVGYDEEGNKIDLATHPEAHDGDKRLIVTGSGTVVILDDYLKQNPPQPGQVAPGAKPGTPPVATLQPGEQPTDKQQEANASAIAEKIIKAFAETGSLYQAVSGVGRKVYDMAKRPDPRLPDNIGRYDSPDLTHEIMTDLGVVGEYDEAEFAEGLKEEMEHADITGGDRILTGKIVVAHLKENPQYYTILEEAMSKAAGGPNPDFSDGVMVALDIPSGLATNLFTAAKAALPAGCEPLPVTDFHITLAYIGKISDPGVDRDKLSTAVRMFASQAVRLVGRIGGLGTFSAEGGKVPLVAFFDCPELPDFRQNLALSLDMAGVPYSKLHGFIPHITLAYIPADSPAIKVELPPAMLEFSEILCEWGNDKSYYPLGVPESFQKHCGVCPEDDEYFGAPVIRNSSIDYPGDTHVNSIEIVAMAPEGLPPRPALWKPLGGENDHLKERIGGPQYVREEAAYHLDRSLGFYLVPVAYCADLDGEPGAILHYVKGAPAAEGLSTYGAVWLERAGVFDYIAHQTDRNLGNWLTHPDDPHRLILVDNGLTFPVDGDKSKAFYDSVFVKNILDKPLSNVTMKAVKLCVGDADTWHDVSDLVGPDAANRAKARAQLILEKGCVPSESSDASS